MGESVSSDEARAKTIAAMGEALGDVHFALERDLVWLHLKWSNYRAMFANPQTIDLLNQAAPAFFYVIDRTIWEDVVLNLCRLTDRPVIFGHETLSLRRLPSLIEDKEFRAEIQALVDSIVEKTKFARGWRDRRLAHTELPPASGEGPSKPLPDASRQDIEIALEGMRDLLNRIQRKYQGTTMYYDAMDGGPGGVQSMLARLKEGLDARSQRFRDAGVPEYLLPDASK